MKIKKNKTVKQKVINTLRDPKYIYLESVRRDLSNVEIYKMS